MQTVHHTVCNFANTNMSYFKSNKTFALMSSEAEPIMAWNLPGSATQACLSG